MEVRENELQLNIAGHGGTACVALLDENMTPIPGFEAENCLPIAEDAVRASVCWRTGAAPSSLTGRLIHVFVEMDAGSLYAIRV
jgi:hypothetical protein